MTSTILTCACGAKVRVPAGAEGRSFRCPKCKAAIVATPGTAPLVASRLDAGTQAVCPICQTAMQTSEECITCPSCDQVHHRECWSEIGGCGTYGCAKAPSQDKSEHSPQAPLTAWGDTKKCPACGETIKSIALRCRYCGTDFHSVDPLSVADLHRQLEKNQENENAKKSVTAIFVLSLIGVLAPLALVIGLIYVLPRRERLAKCGPLFVIMGWASILLSTIYSLMMLLFFLSEMM